MGVSWQFGDPGVGVGRQFGKERGYNLSLAKGGYEFGKVGGGGG